jgi:hypothetical protein
MKKIICTIILVLFNISFVSADENGGYAASFLQIPIGARPTAMGGAYTAIASDGSGPLYNPAGLGMVMQKMFSTSYRSMKLDRQLGYINYIHPYLGYSVIGVGWLYAGSGSVEARNNDGDLLGFELSHNTHSFSVYFARLINPLISVGFKASYLYSSFAEMKAYSILIDGGVMLYYNGLIEREAQELSFVQDIQVGLVIRNLGGKLRWNGENYVNIHTTGGFAFIAEDEIPTELSLGGSAKLFEKRLLLALDLLKMEYQSLYLNLGSEFKVVPEFSLRAGLNNGRLAAGTGYVVKVGSSTLMIDYAFSTDKADEGSEHIFSFDFMF